MTLELLFLKAGQCRTFLTMVLLGERKVSRRKK